MDIRSLTNQSPAAARALAASGAFADTTAGLAPGFVQGNIVILPAEFATSFETFCRANAQACPLIHVGIPGDPTLAPLGSAIDIRTNLPRYRVFHDGVCTEQPTGITALWRGDLVTFVLGCSFTFERALLAAGIPLRHIEQGRNVAMYRTTILTRPAPPFGGPLVVSMRPMSPEDARRAIAVTARFHDMHGAPVHIGDPIAIGIANLARPDFGDAVDFAPGDVPVFWACGVTSQSALEQARLPFAITHAPGCMLITDLPEQFCPINQ
ncbi:putative hydro-lyase [Acidiphilium sp. AL]|uniref:Putative hydro-lyase L2A60_04005 n=1 Tax=Acidiphilium iwatense TaxID=768198 RepID=A0ABS9DT37_9PROT|nr:MULTISPECIES: putative hydro-lyase [Acidiphilium]MCF3945847.1 putative hydro-lyase [Acidiphilium iwatense]MCU4159272.1 putative hydro-lyase [Acidiphilium sp. AL]